MKSLGEKVTEHGVKWQTLMSDMGFRSVFATY